MLLGCPNVVRANYICFKFWKEAHAMWIGMKCFFGLKINGAVIFHLLNSTITGSNRKNSMERMI